LNRDDVPSLLTAADVFCMPSLWEGLPLAVLEAMFASTAIVASATSGIPEAITSEREGLLVPPGDDAALAAALRRALESPAERARLAGAALRRAENDFTIGSMADAYERLYYGDGDE
jgi:glycosyltransferase involved in cell wall biosynthesis